MKTELEDYQLEKWRDHYYAAQDVAFHLTSSDRELVEKVSSIMKRNGHLSFSDSMGNEHYLLDGRRGVPFLTKNIDSVTKRLLAKTKDDYEKMRPYFTSSIDTVLEMSNLPKRLKGYRYVKYMLYRLIEDDSLISPLSKTIYPELCELYNCTSYQVERDIRYAIKRSGLTGAIPSPKSFVCSLLDYASRLSYDMSVRDAKSAQSDARETQYSELSTREYKQNPLSTGDNKLNTLHSTTSPIL